MMCAAVRQNWVTGRWREREKDRKRKREDTLTAVDFTG